MIKPLNNKRLYFFSLFKVFGGNIEIDAQRITYFGPPERTVWNT